jgi:hypothetical protein
MSPESCQNPDISPEEFSRITEIPDVKLFAWTQGDDGVTIEDPPVYGALGCYEEYSSYQLYQRDKELSHEKKNNKIERMFKETSGRGHGSVLDQCRFIFSIENLPRLSTLHLCQLMWGEHLQQSLRRANASRGYNLSPDIL